MYLQRRGRYRRGQADGRRHPPLYSSSSFPSRLGRFTLMSRSGAPLPLERHLGYFCSVHPSLGALELVTNARFALRVSARMPTPRLIVFCPSPARFYRCATPSCGHPRIHVFLPSEPSALPTLSCRTARCAHEHTYFDLPWSVHLLYLVARSFYIRSAILPCSHVFTRLTVIRRFLRLCAPHLRRVATGVLVRFEPR